MSDPPIIRPELAICQWLQEIYPSESRLVLLKCAKSTHELVVGAGTTRKLSLPRKHYLQHSNTTIHHRNTHATRGTHDTFNYKDTNATPTRNTS